MQSWLYRRKSSQLTHVLKTQCKNSAAISGKKKRSRLVWITACKRKIKSANCLSIFIARCLMSKFRVSSFMGMMSP